MQVRAAIAAAVLMASATPAVAQNPAFQLQSHLEQVERNFKVDIAGVQQQSAQTKAVVDTQNQIVEMIADTVSVNKETCRQFEMLPKEVSAITAATSLKKLFSESSEDEMAKFNSINAIYNSKGDYDKGMADYFRMAGARTRHNMYVTAGDALSSDIRLTARAVQMACLSRRIKTSGKAVPQEYRDALDRIEKISAIQVDGFSVDQFYLKTAKFISSVQP